LRRPLFLNHEGPADARALMRSSYHFKIDAVTYAAVHDRMMLPVLLSDDDKDCDVYADKGYAGIGPKAEVISVEATPRIMHKGKRNRPVTAEQKAENKQWAKIRSRVEHVFGDQHTGMHLTKIRTRRKTRAEFTIRLKALVIGKAYSHDGKKRPQQCALIARISFNSRSAWCQGLF